MAYNDETGKTISVRNHHHSNLDPKSRAKNKSCDCCNSSWDERCWDRTRSRSRTWCWSFRLSRCNNGDDHHHESNNGSLRERHFKKLICRERWREARVLSVASSLLKLKGFLKAYVVWGVYKEVGQSWSCPV